MDQVGYNNKYSDMLYHCIYKSNPTYEAGLLVQLTTLTGYIPAYLTPIPPHITPTQHLIGYKSIWGISR